MRLSEAIRLGAMMKPQGFGEPLSLNGHATCGFGAAVDAIGMPTRDVLEGEYVTNGRAGGFAKRGCKALIIPAEWNPFLEEFHLCPSCSAVSGNGMTRNGLQAITHLNDFHRWTRERIANWVELQELQEEFLIPAQSPESETVSPDRLPLGGRS